MSRILIFIACYILATGNADAAIRDGTVTVRNAHTPQRVVSTQPVVRSTAQRSTILRPNTNNPTRAASNITARSAASDTRTATSRNTAPQTATISRNATPVVTTRAATTDASAMSQTRTGAEYEQCKSAYFACMDQFCQLKNDTYRRCSCSDRVYSLDDAFDTLAQAGEQLTTFTENLDVVGMTAAQATSMKIASDGENALTSDTSASKALLQAIMNSIRGTDSTVGGKYSDLNSINISFDTANAFGTMDVGQTIATYNGQNLYSAVYPQCRDAVRSDCNDASLQRAITAYLMAVEQDCNTVQTALTNKQKQMKAAVREGDAMLDLARVENRKKHNSSNFAQCLNDVENAILSEEVCGANYHKCLDNGEFIDISTGKPIAGVERFYELEQLLTFSDNVDAANQKLSQVVKNRQFVNNFEARVKKFAEPALDKCVESADEVWAQYLDKALLDIYYAQKSKVSEIKQGCFDFISTCYMNVDTGLTAAMKDLIDGSEIVINPDKIELNTQMCRDYIDSCNNMFDDNIIAEYVNNRKDTDRITACRAVAKQCFDKFGGAGYQNFYYPYSGLFERGYALDWMTLYDHTNTDCTTDEIIDVDCYASECAKQLAGIESCKDKETIETVFGGFDKFYVTDNGNNQDQMAFRPANAPGQGITTKYGTLKNVTDTETVVRHREPRPTGVATEIYYQIIDTLSTQCTNIQGRFMELQFLQPLNSYDNTNLCLANFKNSSKYNDLVSSYGIADSEDMCPRDYGLGVDIPSWGACLCWENGGRRSKWGTSPTCVAELPVNTIANDDACNATHNIASASKDTPEYWCTRGTTIMGQVCPIDANEGTEAQGYKCVNSDGTDAAPDLPEGLTK